MARKMWLTRDDVASVFVGLLAAASFWLSGPWHRYHLLAKDPVRTQAQVSLLDCHSHATFIYPFKSTGGLTVAAATRA